MNGVSLPYVMFAISKVSYWAMGIMFSWKKHENLIKLKTSWTICRVIKIKKKKKSKENTEKYLWESLYRVYTLVMSIRPAPAEVIMSVLNKNRYNLT